ncbi:hypothetical protein TNCT_385541 [Trichonephila clavata]|uniref:Uncharacterized protein n=1 Tax=Trichonephila clavata TaxID=2740835 RepID=A0A8X6J0X9_TRICU|nr:hypothetical protein TNCT_385541 [Trichonephila clavata]
MLIDKCPQLLEVLTLQPNPVKRNPGSGKWRQRVIKGIALPLFYNFVIGTAHALDKRTASPMASGYNRTQSCIRKIWG